MDITTSGRLCKWHSNFLLANNMIHELAIPYFSLKVFQKNVHYIAWEHHSYSIGPIRKIRILELPLTQKKEALTHLL